MSDAPQTIAPVATDLSVPGRDTEPLEPGESRIRPIHWIILTIILIGGLGLRVYRLGDEGLWVDELASLMMSGGYDLQPPSTLPREVVIESPPDFARLDDAPPIWRIWTNCKNDVHPPLYYMALRLWRDMFGSSDRAILSLSVLSSLIAIGLLFDIGRLLYGTGAALWAAALMALAHPQIVHAQDARGYMMALALTLAATDAMVRIERHRRVTGWTGSILFLAVLASVLTHYFSVASAAGLGFYALIRLRGRTRWQVLGIFAASGLAFLLAWGPFLREQLQGWSFGASVFVDEPQGHAARVLDRLLSYPMHFFAPPPADTEWAGRLAVLLLVIPLLLLRRRPVFLLPLLVAFSCFGLVAILDLVRGTLQLNLIRFVFGAGPMIYLLCAALLGVMRPERKWLRHILPAGFAVFCAISLPLSYRQLKGGWREFGAEASARVRPGDMILFYSRPSWDWYNPILYVEIQHYSSQSLRCPIALLTEPPAPAVMARAQAAPRVWLVSEMGAEPLVLPGFSGANRAFVFPVGSITQLVPAKRSR